MAPFAFHQEKTLKVKSHGGGSMTKLSNPTQICFLLYLSYIILLPMWLLPPYLPHSFHPLPLPHLKIIATNFFRTWWIWKCSSIGSNQPLKSRKWFAKPILYQQRWWWWWWWCHWWWSLPKPSGRFSQCTITCGLKI